MSGQYPSGYNNPLGGHRGQFNPQQQQQMMNSMNTMSGGPQAGGGMMPMGGGYAQGGLIPQQQTSPMQSGGGIQSTMAGVSSVNIVPGSGNAPGGGGTMNPQQIMQQQQMGMVGQTGGASSVMNTGGLIQQQHQMNISAAQQQSTQSGASGGLHQQQQPQTSTQSIQQSSNSMLAISQPNPHKEINIVALSRLGQETVQDITSRFQEIFAALKIIQPTANRDNNTEKKVQEYFRTIRLLFKRVRIIYEKCNDGYPQGMEYTQVESLIPYKEELDHRIELTQCEEYRKALQENQELIETVKLKNRQLREIIDRTRIIIWEINTMLSMRRS